MGQLQRNPLAPLVVHPKAQGLPTHPALTCSQSEIKVEQNIVYIKKKKKICENFCYYKNHAYLYANRQIVIELITVRATALVTADHIDASGVAAWR